MLLGIHVGLNWQWVINVFNRLLKIKEPSQTLRYAGRAALILVLVAGIYGLSSTGYFSRVALIGSITPNLNSLHERSFYGDASFGQKIGTNIEKTGKGYGFRGGRADNSLKFDRHQFGEHAANGSANADIPKTMVSFLAIIGLFSVLTNYLAKSFTNQKAKQLLP
jgi:hypothetical protein